MLLSILIGIHVVVSILLIFVIVVLQSGKGESLAGVIGGEIGSTLGGKKGATAITKFTTYLAITFMGLALVIGVLSMNTTTVGTNGVEDALREEQPTMEMTPVIEEEKVEPTQEATE